MQDVKELWVPVGAVGFSLPAAQETSRWSITRDRGSLHNDKRVNSLRHTVLMMDAPNNKASKYTSRQPARTQKASSTAAARNLGAACSVFVPLWWKFLAVSFLRLQSSLTLRVCNQADSSEHLQHLLEPCSGAVAQTLLPLLL